MYLHEKELPPVLCLEEEREIVKQKEAGCPKARNLLVEHNMRLVHFLIKGLHLGNASKEDVIEDGYIALIETVDRFDSHYECQFATYAYQCIRFAMLSSIYAARCGAVTIPTRARNELVQLEKEISELEVHHENVNHELLSRRMTEKYGWSKGQIKSILDARSATQIQDERAIDSHTTQTDIETHINRAHAHQVFQYYFNQLTDEESYVIKSRYEFLGPKKSKRVLSEETNLSIHAISVIEQKFFNRISKHIESDERELLLSVCG